VSGRKVDYDVQRPGFFVMTGSQGSKKFYIRAHAQDHDVRGFTILYEAAKDATIQPLTVAISNAFAPFSGQGTIQVSGRVARPKVEYTTGLIASAAGHILADKEATEGCKVITVPQVGPAERAAADPASGLALLRAYGASDLRPAALAGGAGNGNAVTLVGVADPRAQFPARPWWTGAAGSTGPFCSRRRWERAPARPIRRRCSFLPKPSARSCTRRV